MVFGSEGAAGGPGSFSDVPLRFSGPARGYCIPNVAPGRRGSALSVGAACCDETNNALVLFLSNML